MTPRTQATPPAVRARSPPRSAALPRGSATRPDGCTRSLPAFPRRARVLLEPGRGLAPDRRPQESASNRAAARPSRELGEPTLDADLHRAQMGTAVGKRTHREVESVLPQSTIPLSTAASDRWAGTGLEPVNLLLVRHLKAVSRCRTGIHLAHSGRVDGTHGTTHAIRGHPDVPVCTSPIGGPHSPLPLWRQRAQAAVLGSGSISLMAKPDDCGYSVSQSCHFWFFLATLWYGHPR